MDDNVLPFPRGATIGDNYTTLTDTTFQELEGRVYYVPDTLHSTKTLVGLRAVKNDSGAAITVTRGLLLRWSTTSSTDVGRRVAGASTAQGERVKPLDDYYAASGVATIPDDDIFWVLENGYGQVLTEATSVNLTAGDEVVSQGDGTLDGTAAADGDYVFGVVTETTTSTSTATMVYVHEGLGHIKG